MPTPTHSLKRSEGLGTALTRNYRENPYVRSTVNVVLLQTLFVLLNVLVLGLAIWHQTEATDTIIGARRAAIKAGAVLTPESLDYALAYIRNSTLSVVLGVLVTISILFGYLAARFALWPTRNSLEYQKRFIGNIAHELRTPLAVMRTSTEVALMDDSLNDYTRSTLTGTIEELDRISEIINNLLSFDTLMKPGRIQMVPINLVALLALVMKRHEELAATRGIDLTYTGNGDEAAYVLGNEVALIQVFTNLIKNALNYTPTHDGRKVEVVLKNVDDTILVSVADTGIGIAQKDMYHIFEPFYRGEKSRERGVSGGTSGLGLAIVNDIVRAHHGSIIIRSALNRGTTIEITFPKADTTEYVQALAEDEDGSEHELAVVKH